MMLVLDEVEICFHPEYQRQFICRLRDMLAKFRFNKYSSICIIIATHSPFMLGTLNAKIYNLDTKEYDVTKWSDLDNVRYFYNFFKKHEDEFKV